MVQKSSFHVPVNPTVVLVTVLVLAMVFGNRWRQTPPIVDEDDVADRIEDDATAGQPKGDDDSEDDQRYPHLDDQSPSEPQRLHYEHLIGDAHPIENSVANDDTRRVDKGWITPPRKRPVSLETSKSASTIRPPGSDSERGAYPGYNYQGNDSTEDASNERRGSQRPGSLVSLTRDSQSSERQSTARLSAPVTDSAAQEPNWRPVESIAPGRAIPIDRLPKVPNSTEPVATPEGSRHLTEAVSERGGERGAIESEGNAEDSTENSGTENSGIEKSGIEKSGIEKSGIEKSGLPPLIPPQTIYEASPGWRPVALQTAAPAPSRKEQVAVETLEMSARQSSQDRVFSENESTEIDWDAIERAKEVAQAEATQRAQVQAPRPTRAPLNPQAVRSSETTASRHLSAATQFASHRALAAANAELESALRTLAAGADASSEQPMQVNQLGAAMRALSEAEDFLPGAAATQSGQSAREIARRHRTSVVRLQDRNIPATDAVEIYFSFAQQSILNSVGHSRLSSEILYQLGKVYTESSGTTVSVTRAPAARATLFHETALRIDPTNYKSANELAVLLAKAGQWHRAKSYLLHSLTIKQLPEAWFNLAKVHDQLGETGLAQRARHEYQLLAQQPATATQAAVQWVAPQQFEAAAALRPPPIAPNGLPNRSTRQPVAKQPNYPAYNNQSPAREVVPRSAAGGSTRWGPRRGAR